MATLRNPGLCLSSQTRSQPVTWSTTCLWQCEKGTAVKESMMIASSLGECRISHGVPDSWNLYQWKSFKKEAAPHNLSNALSARWNKEKDHPLVEGRDAGDKDDLTSRLCGRMNSGVCHDYFCNLVKLVNSDCLQIGGEKKVMELNSLWCHSMEKSTSGNNLNLFIFVSPQAETQIFSGWVLVTSCLLGYPLRLWWTCGAAWHSSS